MASQITHVVYGRKIFDRLNANLNWPEFVIGTTFPDIRYISEIERNSTHKFNTSEKSIPPENSFEAGFYTHSLVDEKRESFIESKGIYKYISGDWIGVSALKLVEDEVLYDGYMHWPQLIKTYNNFYEQEFRLVPDREAVQNWHKFLQGYFRVKPTKEIWYKAIVFITSDKKVAKEVIKATSKIKRNTKVMNIISETYGNI